jgi:hypothetical protein
MCRKTVNIYNTVVPRYQNGLADVTTFKRRQSSRALAIVH